MPPRAPEPDPLAEWHYFWAWAVLFILLAVAAIGRKTSAPAARYTMGLVIAYLLLTNAANLAGPIRTLTRWLSPVK